MYYMCEQIFLYVGGDFMATRFLRCLNCKQELAKIIDISMLFNCDNERRESIIWDAMNVGAMRYNSDRSVVSEVSCAWCNTNHQVVNRENKVYLRKLTPKPN